MAGITGCESDGDTGSDLDSYFAANPYISDPRIEGRMSSDGLDISPETATASTVGQQILFTITGGDDPITWAVAGGAGTITRQTNTRQAIYTVSTIAENNVIASDNRGRAAIAVIEVAVTSLAVTPTAATVDPANTSYPNQVTLSASGGTAPYAWSATYTTICTVAPAAGASTVYLATPGAANINTNTVNTVTVTDSKGNTSSAQITHHN